MNLILFTSMTIILYEPIKLESLVDIENQVQQHRGGRINLVINSPGGDVEIGKKLMGKIRRLNKPIDCLVIGEAMSMAFTMLTMCDNRYTLATSQFLVHDVKIYYQNTLMTEKELERDLIDLQETNRWQKKLLTDSLGKYEEGTWSGRQMERNHKGWIKVIDSINWIGTRAGGLK